MILAVTNMTTCDMQRVTANNLKYPLDNLIDKVAKPFEAALMAFLILFFIGNLFFLDLSLDFIFSALSWLVVDVDVDVDVDTGLIVAAK